MLNELAALLDACPPEAPRAEYARVILEQNVLGKRSDSTKRRSLRYLRELYVLDPATLLFRGLRDLEPLVDQINRQHPNCQAALDFLKRFTDKAVSWLPREVNSDAHALAAVTARASIS
jgi:hypothetical protein